MVSPLTRLALPLLLVLGLSALLAGWLTRGDAPAAAADRYVEGIEGRPRTIHPLLTAEDAGADLVALLFDGLMTVDGEGQPRPNLAERWEVTPDGRTYTFVLRPDVTWHDGSRFDSEDVAFTIARVQSPEFAGPAALAAPWSDIEVFVADSRTVLMRLPDVRPDFLTRMTLPVLPEHLLAGLDDDAAERRLREQPVGTGPFRLVELDERHALLERNTSYHRGTPAIREIELRFYDRRAQIVEALQGGEIDAALIAQAPSRDDIDRRDDLSLTLLQRNAFTVLYVNNLQRPLDDPALRRALVASVDPAAIVEGLGLRGRPGEGLFVPGSWAYEPRSRGAGDPEALWAAAGWPVGDDGVRERNGEELRLELATNASPERQAIAAAVAGQLRQHGVAIELVTLPATQLLQTQLQPKRYDLAIFGWEAATDPDPYSGWHSSQISAQGRNIAGYQDATSDRALEAARATLDGAERRELYAQLLDRFEERAGSLVLHYPAVTYVHPTGLDPAPSGLLFAPADRFRDAHRWRLRTAG